MPVFILLIRKIIQLTNLKKKIDEDKRQTSSDKRYAREYMEDAERYRNEARADKIEIEQVKEDIREKVEAVNSLLSSIQDRSKAAIHLETDPDAKDINVQIRDDYLKPRK